MSPVEWAYTVVFGLSSILAFVTAFIDRRGPGFVVFDVLLGSACAGAAIAPFLI